LNLLNKQIKYTTSFQKQLLIGSINGVFLVFILVFLKPFDSDTFNIEYKTLVLSVYGLIFLLNYLLHTTLEKRWYRKHNNSWSILNEAISLSIFFLTIGTFAYLYNELVINEKTYVIKYHIGYFKYVISVFIPMFFPVLIFLRTKFGKLSNPEDLTQISIHGSNKKEKLTIQKQQLLFVKASENYVEIYFTEDNQVKSEVYRNTLSSIAKQVPFLLKSHRSYLVNKERIKEVIGNSQKASILLSDIDLEIPVSKSYYKKIKASLSV